jgi:hypothetical protein
VKRLQQSLLRRELAAASKKDPDIDDDIEDFAFGKLRKKAKNEVENSLARLIYRAKYNLPPNNPLFLDMTDEEIVYELVLQSEYSKWLENRFEEEDDNDKKVIYRNTDEFDEMSKRLERGEDIDLDALMTSEEDWENVDG